MVAIGWVMGMTHDLCWSLLVVAWLCLRRSDEARLGEWKLNPYERESLPNLPSFLLILVTTP